MQTSVRASYKRVINGLINLSQMSSVIHTFKCLLLLSTRFLTWQ
jgi:hypothetical protein